jgi:predicted dehydrogenase
MNIKKTENKEFEARPDVKRIGIVGCGVIADIHAQAIDQIANGQLVAVYSRNRDNAHKIGKKYSVDFYTDWEKFINDTRIDIISICTPSGTHLDFGVKAAMAGKHVVVEKPIEVTVDRGQELIDSCTKSGISLAVIFQYRYLDSVKKMKEMIANGTIGDIFHADAHVKWFRSQEYYDSAAWRGTFALDGGGVLINQAIHTIDLLRYLVGEIDYIFGQIGTYTHQRIEGEDDAAAALRFKNGAMGTIVASTSMSPAKPRIIEIHGSNGTIILDGDDLIIPRDIADESDARRKIKTVGADSPLQGFSPEPHRRQFEEIIDHINKGIQPPVSGEDSLRSLAVVRAIYESSKTMVPIKLS